MNVFDSVDMTPRTERPQADPAYLNALGILNEVRGLRDIAVCVRFVAAQFVKTPTEVLDDSANLHNALADARMQAEFDRIHREAGVTL